MYFYILGNKSASHHRLHFVSIYFCNCLHIYCFMLQTSCMKVVPFAAEYSNNYLARNDSKDFKLAMLEVVKV